MKIKNKQQIVCITNAGIYVIEVHTKLIVLSSLVLFFVSALIFFLIIPKSTSIEDQKEEFYALEEKIINLNYNEWDIEHINEDSVKQFIIDLQLNDDADYYLKNPNHRIALYKIKKMLPYFIYISKLSNIITEGQFQIPVPVLIAHYGVVSCTKYDKKYGWVWGESEEVKLFNDPLQAGLVGSFAEEYFKDSSEIFTPIEYDNLSLKKYNSLYYSARASAEYYTEPKFIYNVLISEENNIVDKWVDAINRVEKRSKSELYKNIIKRYNLTILEY